MVLSFGVFFVYDFNMFRFFTILILFVLPSSSYAQTPFSFCGADALQLDFISDDPNLGASNIAEVHGSLEIPHPGFLYSLIFKEMDSEGVIYGVLTLEDKGGVNIAMVSNIDVRQSVDVAYGASKIVIEVIKPYNWGANYYEAKVSRRETLCLKSRKG